MAEVNRYQGVVVPMVTPLTPAGQIDRPAVKRIVDYLVDHRHAGVFAAGTTGEGASIYYADKIQLVESTVEANAGRAMVYAGIASNCFRESLELAKKFKQLRVDAVVAHVACYYPISDSEIENYFLRLADQVELPLVLYNIPATTNHSISLDSVDRLRKHPNIVALKDSAGDKERITELLKRTGGHGGFPVLLGSSALFTLGLKAGGVGLIPSGGHLVGDLYQIMFEAAMANQWEKVEQMQKETDEVCVKYNKGRSLGQGLAVLKAMLEQKGMCGRTMLPPLMDYTGPL